MIFKLSPDFERTYLPSLDGVELFTKMPGYRPRFFATPRLHDWVTPEGSLYDSANFDRDENAIPDVSTWNTGLVVFSPKAHSVFQELLSGFGEFLPITIKSETWYLFNTLYIIPDAAIDKSNAVEVVDTGVHHGQANVIFDEAFLANEKVLIFKSNTNKLVHCFCTGEFKSLYETHNFKDLIFKPV